MDFINQLVTFVYGLPFWLDWVLAVAACITIVNTTLLAKQYGKSISFPSRLVGLLLVGPILIFIFINGNDMHSHLALVVYTTIVAIFRIFYYVLSFIVIAIQAFAWIVLLLPRKQNADTVETIQIQDRKHTE